MRNPVVRKVVGYAGALAVLLLAWAATAALVNSPALPGPVIAIVTLVEQWLEIWPQIVVSFWRVVAAMVIGTVLAVPLGLWLGRSPHWSRPQIVNGPPFAPSCDCLSWREALVMLIRL